MIISELYDLLEEYSKITGSSKFDINDICIEQMIKVNGDKGYHFLYNDYIYEIRKGAQTTIRFNVYLNLYQATKSLIRKTKIEKLLNN